jgi:hypothetical protein
MKRALITVSTLASVTLASVTLAADTPVAEHVYRIPKKAALEWHLADEWRVWLEAVAYSSDADRKKDGYNPSFTYHVSDYKPMVKKIDGKWQIKFTSEIAEDLP